jgi:hypothetical protein
MPDEPRRGKEFLGQPLWIWGAGAVALVGGYVYLRRKGQAAGQQAAAPAATGTYTSPTGMSWEQFLLFVHDQQGAAKTATATAPKPAPKPKPRPGRPPKPKPRPRVKR